MKLQHTTDVSIRLTIFYLKTTGFWFAVNRTQKYFMNIMVVYTVLSIVSYLGMQFGGLYTAWKDISICAMLIFNVLGVSIGLFKLCFVLIRKEQFLELVAFMQENFWHMNYDFSEKRIVADVRRMCISLVCAFSFFTQFSIVCFSIRPAILNIGRNVSERMLVFPIWLDPPYCDTPYFEIIYAIQVLNLYQGGFCYQCFDNIFCIMCMHVAGQFRVLQHRMINMQSVQRNYDKLHENVSHLSSECLDKLRSCIRQHQALIEFCKVVNEVFTAIMLLQVLMFSLMVCLAGYQLFVLNLNVATRVSVISVIVTNMVQLWMFTYSCNIMTQESLNVNQAAYAAPWIHLPLDVFGKMMRKDLQFVIMRSRIPCCVTAGGFFPVSLETYSRIISTSMSYFTLLRQSTVDPVET